ncbi:hypothetical protein EYF80_036145 [Liparis tanakae]|uniref:Uncharacterized protein n=1 Tax=Liparis tanakae TaxID=230148 RepID=A0A4Z2GJF0_9TELE|nr:hypothetical protein EYF80_036145 [Liparis tanakae]
MSPTRLLSQQLSIFRGGSEQLVGKHPRDRFGSRRGRWDGPHPFTPTERRRGRRKRKDKTRKIQLSPLISGGGGGICFPSRRAGEAVTVTSGARVPSACITVTGNTRDRRARERKSDDEGEEEEERGSGPEEKGRGEGGKMNDYKAQKRERERGRVTAAGDGGAGCLSA